MTDIQKRAEELQLELGRLWDGTGTERLAAIAAALAAAEAAAFENAAQVAERTTVRLDGIVIESLNANRSAIVSAIRQLAGKGGE